jgi:hypothetical protein
MRSFGRGAAGDDAVLARHVTVNAQFRLWLTVMRRSFGLRARSHGGKCAVSAEARAA